MENIITEYFRLRISSPITSLEEELLSTSYMVFMLEGEMEYRIDRKSIKLHAGDALYLPPGTLRERPAKFGAAKYYSVLFKNAPPEYAEKLPTVFKHSSVQEIILTLSMIEKLFFSRFHGNSDDMLEKRLSILMELLLNLSVSASLTAENNPYVEKILDYIRTNYKSKLTLNAIADAVHLNPSYCATLFRTETGETIGNFIKNLRIDIARDELARGNSVKVTSESVGFTDPYNFSKWFLKNVGISPSDYRKAHLIKNASYTVE